jgi:hypothetical protein
MTVGTTFCLTAETPCVVVTAERSPRSGIWILTVARCPFCGKRHSHGGGDGPEPALGHRVAHCGDHAGSYELIETAASITGRTLPYGCIGPGCAVETDRGLDRCSGCAP